MKTQVLSPPPQSVIKNHMIKKLIWLIYILQFLIINPLFIKAQFQSITVDTTITADCEFYPFSSSSPIYGLDISGNVTLNSDTSLVRVILYDTLFNEYLLFESYPLIASQPYFYFNNESDETRYLNGIVPYSLEVQIINSSIEINTLGITQTYVAYADSLRYEHKLSKEILKVSQMNINIDAHEMLWFADTSSVGLLSFADKKSLFGDKYNLKGLDYYVGGLFFPFGSAIAGADDSEIIDHWDWRVRHGANDPIKSDYNFDSNSDGVGWMTSVKNQNDRVNCTGLCYIYAPLASLEGLLNIYINNPDHPDYNLSEEHVLDCNPYASASDCEGGDIGGTYKFVKLDGVLEETCYPMDNVAEVCILQQCNSPEHRFKIYDYQTMWMNPNNLTYFKELIIQKGPLSATFANYLGGSHHAMSIVGYGTVKDGDEFINSRDESDTKLVSNESDYLGKTY